ncbi:MAG TPA: cyclic pyranopterin monophosphate synthase MoaC [Candidatus Aminicenantes bacterium]|nr:cyclic pyranopterin monophosphate synthase MoaC [Candidatus Aminicenantes bacterium]
MPLTHVDEHGDARMVDISAKVDMHREAVARGRIALAGETLALIARGGVPKGDVLAVARIAGITGGKRTSDLIPLCHNIPIHSLDVEFAVEPDGIGIVARARTVGRTGIEMEALTAVAIAALTIYDMCKAVDKSMVIGPITLVEKHKHAIPD